MPNFFDAQWMTSTLHDFVCFAHQLAAVKNELDLWRSGRLKADDD